jgi:hypothetical protein
MVKPTLFSNFLWDGCESASLKESKGRWWFKCFRPQCPSQTSGDKGSWDEVGYLAFKTGLSRKEPRDILIPFNEEPPTNVVPMVGLEVAPALAPPPPPPTKLKQANYTITINTGSGVRFYALIPP